MLDFETDQDTHFQCPKCGQKGSVPNATLEKALAETPHVHISCSNCAHKFEPFADLIAEHQDAAAAAETLSPLEAHWQQDDAAQEAAQEAALSDQGGGDLPSWLMPAGKPQTDETPPKALDETAPQNDAAAALAEIEAVVEAAVETELETELETEPETELAPEADVQPQAEIEPQTEIEPEPEVEIEPEAYGDAARAIAPPIPPGPIMPHDATDHMAADMTADMAKGDPMRIVNRLLVIMVVALIGLSFYVTLGERETDTGNLPSATESATFIKMQKAGFVRFTEDGEAGIEVSVRFENTGAQRGIIGDFRINLQNEARETLVQWTVLSTGEVIAAGQTRNVKSVLFGPPKGLAHIAIDYPLAD